MCNFVVFSRWFCSQVAPRTQRNGTNRQRRTARSLVARSLAPPARTVRVRVAAARSRRAGTLAGCEVLETRALLAGQTTGLFFSNPGVSDNYTLVSPATTLVTNLIDKQGQVVHQWQSSYAPGLLAYLLDDGSLLRAAAPHGQGGNGSIVAAGAGGLVERFDWNGQRIWEFAYDSPTHLAHHDIEPLPNGHVLLIAWERKTEAEATAAGRDPTLPGPGFLYPDQIVEVAPDLQNGGGQIVWQWNVWDHLVQDFDATKVNWRGATGVADHPELIDLNYVSSFDAGSGANEDWTHANGIDYNAETDQIMLSVREFSEFWIIDHSTTTAEAAGHIGGRSGRGGDLLYRWGNPQTYRRGDDSDRQLYYQHDAKWITSDAPGAGHVTLFNNGFGRPGLDYSAVEEIVLPTPLANGSYPLAAGQAYEPTSSLATYEAPLENFSAIISGAQRLTNGNTLVTYGVNGTLTEVTPAGNEVWKYVNPYTGARTLGPMEPIPSLGIITPGLDALRTNFVFRAIDYPRSLVLPFLEPLVGDANHDGTVGAADYAIWAAQFGLSGQFLAADFDHNGSVGAADYALWAANFGATQGGGTAPGNARSPTVGLPGAAVGSSAAALRGPGAAADKVTLLGGNARPSFARALSSSAVDRVLADSWLANDPAAVPDATGEIDLRLGSGPALVPDAELGPGAAGTVAASRRGLHTLTSRILPWRATGDRLLSIGTTSRMRRN